MVLMMLKVSSNEFRQCYLNLSDVHATGPKTLVLRQKLNPSLVLNWVLAVVTD